MSQFRDLVDDLKAKVRSIHPPYNSWHEAHSILREEFEEFWDEVKKKQSERDPERLLSELVDIVQVAERAAEDFKLVSSEPASAEERETYYAEKYNELAQAVINFLRVSTLTTPSAGLQMPRAKDYNRVLDIPAAAGKIVSVLVPREYLENLETLVENDIVLPAQSS